MADQEFNERVAQEVARLQLLSTLRSLGEIDEYEGKWDEQAESYSSQKESFEALFQIPASELTVRNLMAIAHFRKVEYPQCLCDLGKCYMAQDRYYLAESHLNAAADAGITGAVVLLFSLYMENADKAQRNCINLFYRVRNLDIWSEQVRKEINNDIFWGFAVVELAFAYHVIEHDNAMASDLLLKVMKFEHFQMFENIRKHAKDTLLKIKSGK